MLAWRSLTPGVTKRGRPVSGRRGVMAAVLLAGAALPAAALAGKPPPLDDSMPNLESGKPAAIGAPETFRPAPGPPIGAFRPGFGSPSPGTTLPSGRLVSSGSGFIVAEGMVLTNDHVIEGCGHVLARNAHGEIRAARLDAADARRDLALLSVAPDFGPALTFRGGPAVERGESVITYGFPLTGVLSSGPSLTTGSVSALSGLRDNPLHFQISAPVQPGNSGGPLLDAQSHVIGVIVSKLDAAQVAKLTGGDIPQNVNFAIKGDEARAFLEQHGVAPATAPSTGPEQRAAVSGEVAHPSTVFIQCFR
jgi:S1-C subfamily serine protease